MVVHEDEACKLHGGQIFVPKLAAATWILRFGSFFYEEATVGVTTDWVGGAATTTGWRINSGRGGEAGNSSNLYIIRKYQEMTVSFVFVVFPLILIDL